MASHELFGIVGKAQPARVEQHHITFADFHPLRFRLGLDFGLVEDGAGRQRVLLEVSRHVQQHAAADDGRQFLDGKLGQAGGVHEIRRR